MLGMQQHECLSIKRISDFQSKQDYLMAHGTEPKIGENDPLKLPKKDEKHDPYTNFWSRGRRSPAKWLLAKGHDRVEDRGLDQGFWLEDGEVEYKEPSRFLLDRLDCYIIISKVAESPVALSAERGHASQCKTTLQDYFDLSMHVHMLGGSCMMPDTRSRADLGVCFAAQSDGLDQVVWRGETDMIILGWMQWNTDFASDSMVLSLL